MKLPLLEHTVVLSRPTKIPIIAKATIKNVTKTNPVAINEHGCNLTQYFKQTKSDLFPDNDKNNHKISMLPSRYKNYLILWSSLDLENKSVKSKTFKSTCVKREKLLR